MVENTIDFYINYIREKYPWLLIVRSCKHHRIQSYLISSDDYDINVHKFDKQITHAVLSSQKALSGNRIIVIDLYSIFGDILIYG